MTCTKFPSTGLVPNVTTHQVGSVTYLYKGGAPTAPLWEAITGPLAAKVVTKTGGGSVQDFIDAQYTTTLEIATGKFKVGELVVVSDRNNHTFKLQAGGASDGWAILPAGDGIIAVIQKDNGIISADGCGAKPEVGFDSKPAILSAWGQGRIVKFDTSGAYYLSSELRYPTNATELHGVQSAPFSSSTFLMPLDSTYSDARLVDMNEKGSASGTYGGQFNVLKNITVQGGMSLFTNAEDPLVGLIGVDGLNTVDSCRMENVTFRLCGKPFRFTGWKHNHKQIEVYQCYTGGDLSSTNSSVIDGYNIQTCAKNWGTLEGCTINNATLQQGNEKPTLDENSGVRINGLVAFTGFLYTEGGSAQLNISANSKAIVQNWLLGFAQLKTGVYGAYNVRVANESSIEVRGGRSGGVKSFLVGGETSLAKSIILDIDEYDGRVIDSVTPSELPACKNLLIKRTYGAISRVNFNNEIHLSNYSLGVATKVIWDQFVTPSAAPFNGQITVGVGGSNTHDLYRVDFSDGSAGPSQVIINTIFRNTGGSGDNNINLTYSGGELIAQGRKSDQTVSVSVTGHGSMWPKAIV